jgi:flagellar L-ring protein precursor FlgH
MKHKFGYLLLACSVLSACSTMEDRVANIGKAPAMTQIANPVTQPGYQPVSMPMPAPQNITREKNSLWASDRQTFFKDQRAKNIGDIITVKINIDDEAQIENETQRTRESDERAGLPKLLGGETKLGEVFAEAVDPTSLISGSSDSEYRGNGEVDRSEEIELEMAAVITQILPNGNMVIHGKQEVRVNFEKRMIGIDGVIRPQDIAVDNSISSEKIAEARIAYGGQGQLTDMQQPRYGQQLYDAVFPF